MKEGLSKKQAVREFAPIVNKAECPQCGAKKGKMCNSDTVWVHPRRVEHAYA